MCPLSLYITSLFPPGIVRITHLHTVGWQLCGLWKEAEVHSLDYSLWGELSICPCPIPHPLWPKPLSLLSQQVSALSVEVASLGDPLKDPTQAWNPRLTDAQSPVIPALREWEHLTFWAWGP